MVLVPISEAESSHKVKDVPGSANHEHHESSSDDSSWKMESDSESNSSSGSSDEDGEPAEPLEMDFDGHVEERKEEKRKREDSDSDAVRKRYKLRPRNANGMCKNQRQIESQLAKGKSQVTPASRSRKRSTKKAVVKEEHRKFSVALSQEEIANDFFAITGKKPSSRPHKRDKKLQQILDVRKSCSTIDSIFNLIMSLLDPVWILGI